MLSRFKDFLAENKLHHPKDRYLLAVSGGVDSVVMAHLFKEAGFPFAVVHCNFSLRGKASDADETFVRKLAERHDVPCFVKRFETEAYARENRLSIQEAARNLRYAWFEEVRQKEKYTQICTAHHRDDSQETFFINLLRGTGLAGLTGVPVKNNRVIRPLLFAFKAELEAYALENRLKYRQDKSNESDDYLRNRLRHQLFSLLETLNPAYRQTLDRSMRQLSEANTVLHDYTLLRRGELLKPAGKEWVVRLDTLKETSPLSFWLLVLLNDFGFSETVLHNLADLLAKKAYAGKVFQADNYELLVESQQLRIRKRVRNKKRSPSLKISRKQASYTLPFPFELAFKKAGPHSKIPRESMVGCLDTDKLKFPLLLRKYKTGDRFRPLGMKGSKLVSDFMTDHKFPQSVKENTWVLESEGQIAWLVGLRIDERFKVDKDTTEIALFRVEGEK
jgi:tRNA(Ile)-lysidine synthase